MPPSSHNFGPIHFFSEIDFLTFWSKNTVTIFFLFITTYILLELNLLLYLTPKTCSGKKTNMYVTRLDFLQQQILCFFLVWQILGLHSLSQGFECPTFLSAPIFTSRPHIISIYSNISFAISDVNFMNCIGLNLTT